MIFSNLVNREYERYNVRLDTVGREIYTTNIKYLAPGNYTLTAVTDPDPQVGKDIKCYARGTKNDGTAWSTTGESALPMSFTVSEVSDVMFFFGYEGFRNAAPSERDDIAVSAVSFVKCGDPNTPDRDIYENAALVPDEICDSDGITQAISLKSSVTLRIYPDFESWGFCKRGITIVRIIDLDRTQDRTIFKGRVSAVNDIMENGGAIRQDIICVSAADFLEDTGFADGIEPQSLSNWLAARCTAHNNQVELARRYTVASSGSATVSSGTEYLCKTNFGLLNEVLTGGKYLTENGRLVKYEWREKYLNDVVYIETAAKLGTDKDTPFKIGDNLSGISIEQDTSGGIYTSVMVVSGVNADGYRATARAANAEMLARYHNGRQLVIVNDSIYFTGPGGREYTANGWNWYVTPAVAAMQAALREYAAQEATKLGNPPIKITLTAADLSQMGFSGYEPFEVGNSHPLVYPPGGYFGQRVRITGIRRRLSDGRIEQITIAQGQQPGENRDNGSLSRQMARLEALNRRVDDETVKQTEIINTKIGETVVRLTKSEYDALGAYDDTVLYNVDNNGTNELYIGADHISSGGGGGSEPTIETAAVLTSEQMTEWAPEHELVPVDFRGSAHVYYAQPPAKIVIQGQRGIFGNAPITTDDLAAEIVFDFTQSGQTVRQKLKVFISTLEYYSNDDLTIRLGTACYNVTGAAEVLVGFSEVEYDINLTTPLNSISVGILLIVESLIAQDPDELAAQCRIQVGCISGQNQWFRYANSISGSLFNRTFSVNFGSDAERGFASGIARRTEPSS